MLYLLSPMSPSTCRPRIPYLKHASPRSALLAALGTVQVHLAEAVEALGEFKQAGYLYGEAASDLEMAYPGDRAYSEFFGCRYRRQACVFYHNAGLAFNSFALFFNAVANIRLVLLTCVLINSCIAF